LTAVGADATQSTDKTKRYANKKLPSQEMLPKILRTEYGVPEDLAGEGSFPDFQQWKVGRTNSRHMRITAHIDRIRAG
jgi:hypothetical protein